MKCLIIAAGRGSRLSGKGDSKPLIPLLGLSLIERVILTAKKGGVTDFYVVTGYNGEKVRQYLEKFSLHRNINITYIANEEWEEGNGISVLKAEKLLNEHFILVMADHIFDESILAKLKNEKITDNEIMLAVDYNIKANELVDVEDVTKVFVQDNRIRNIGKTISNYNAYDTGIFLCSSAIFRAIEKSINNKDSSLSGSVLALANEGKAKVFDINDDYWIDVDDEKTFKKAEKLLYGKLTKPADGFISRYINRKVSTRIFTPIFLKIHQGITPNQISIVTFIVSLISGFCFFTRHAVAGAFLLQLSSILDGCDGEIARLKHLQSKFGDFFDAVLDRYADGFIFFAIFYYSLSEIGNKEIFGIYWSPLIIYGIGILAVLGHLMVSYTSAKSVANFGYRYKGKWIAAGRGRDIRLFALFIGGLMTYFNPIFVFFALSVLAIQTNIIVLRRILLSWGWFHKKDSLIKNNIKAVIFDFDGTLADTMPFLTELAIKLMTEKYNISEDLARRRYIETTGMPFASQIELIFPDHPNNHEVVAAFESRKIGGVFDHPVFSEVIPTLRYFSNKKIKTFICSSTKQEIITRYCKLNKINELLNGFFGYEPDFGKAEQIDYVIKHYNLDPEEVIFVGDSLRDFEFVKDKKIKFIGISRIFQQIDFQKRGLLNVSCLTDFVKLFMESEKYLTCFENVS